MLKLLSIWTLTTNTQDQINTPGKLWHSKHLLVNKKIHITCYTRMSWFVAMIFQRNCMWNFCPTNPLNYHFLTSGVARHIWSLSSFKCLSNAFTQFGQMAHTTLTSNVTAYRTTVQGPLAQLTQITMVSLCSPHINCRARFNRWTSLRGPNIQCYSIHDQ
jgi:hypothetical protein